MTINYGWWVNYRSVWTLSEAANLFLGFDPQKGGTFYEFNAILGKHESGLILTDSETVWDIKTLKKKGNLEWEDMFYDQKHGEETYTNNKNSLVNFMNEKILAKKITSLPSDDTDDLYFEPIKIVSLFQECFINEPPQALLIALGLNIKKMKKAQPISKSALRAEYKKYVLECESKNKRSSWEDDWDAMEKALGKKPTKEQIKTVRAELAPEAWKQRGRRRSS